MNCLTTETIQHYITGALPAPDALLTTDAHLESCADCRSRLRAALAHVGKSLPAALAPLRGETNCPEEALLSRFVDGDTEDADKEYVETHLSECRLCAADVVALRAFRAELKGYDAGAAKVVAEQASRWGRFWEKVTSVSGQSGRKLLDGWHHIPLYARLLGALLIGVCVGLAMETKAQMFVPLSEIFLRLLGALATPLIFIAVIHALMHADVSLHTARRLFGLILTNMLVAIGIGLLVANILQPGRGVDLNLPAVGAGSPLQSLIDKVPKSMVGALAENNIIQVIFLAVACGLALRITRREQRERGRAAYRVVEDFLETAFRSLMILLQWVMAIVPLAVFAVVAVTVGKEGAIKPMKSLGGFVVAVMLALVLQALFYLLRLRIGSHVRPGRFLKGGSDALLTAFSTASSVATMPVTYACMKNRVGIRQESASLGVLVGTMFNRDGTALYEAMAPMYVSQALGRAIGPVHQLTVGLMSVVASVSTPGIPEAGMVTMLLVFQSVGLPLHYVLVLFAVDWFLDRCRTAINVMGDMSVTCLLDGK